MICNGAVTANELKALAARAKCVFSEDCSDVFEKWSADITRDAAGRRFNVVWFMVWDHAHILTAHPSVRWLS